MILPSKTLINDLVSGLIMAVVSIPGGLANGLLAGVNPVLGLYSMIAGTTMAALFTSSVIMNVDSTSATALATLDALSGIPEDQHLASLVVLGLLVGLFMLILGFLKLGFLVRFISNAMMTGMLDLIGEESVFPAQPQFGAALRQALAAAEERIAQGIENTN